MAPAFSMLWQARARRDAMMISVGVQVLLAAVLMAVAITFCVESFQQHFSLASVDGITQPLTRSFAVLLTAASSIGLSISSIRQWLRTPVSESAKIVDDAASGAIRQKLGFMHIIKKELDRLGQVLQGERPVPSFLDYLLPTALLNGHAHSLLLWLLGLSRHGQDFQRCRMVIYVDDLDRCPTEKVMEVLQSLVLLTEGTPFIILLAIDQRVVVTAIENSGEGLYNDAGVNGHEYLDKIVQIPFVIPQLADDEKANLCKGYLTPGPQQNRTSKAPAALDTLNRYVKSHRRRSYFLSYKQSDGNDGAVQMLADQMRKHGARSVWLDKLAEDRSKTGMTDGVKDSDIFVAVISESYFAAPFCCLEFHTALKFGKPIVVVWNQSKHKVQTALGWIPEQLKFLMDNELLPIMEDVQMAAPCAKRIMAQEMQPFELTGDLEWLQKSGPDAFQVKQGVSIQNLVRDVDIGQ